MKTLSFSSFMRVCLLSAMVSLLFPVSLEAQTTAARPDRGIMPGASYSVSDIENINLSNGNVQVTIPLASLPPIAGGKLNLTLTATYNSKLWNVTRTEHQEGTFFGCPTWVVDTPQESDLGGWMIAAGYRIVFRRRRVTTWRCLRWEQWQRLPTAPARVMDLAAQTTVIARV